MKLAYGNDFIMWVQRRKFNKKSLKGLKKTCHSFGPLNKITLKLKWSEWNLRLIVLKMSSKSLQELK
jgi:hypothetical protein